MKFFGRCNISRTFGVYNTLIKYGGDTTMTWPFENDTSAIVKKLAKRNVSSNRIFCFFNVLTIALAISLIVGISLFPLKDASIFFQAEDGIRDRRL